MQKRMRYICLVNVVQWTSEKNLHETVWKNSFDYYGLLFPKYYCVSKATRPALNGEYILDDVQQFGFDANENDNFTEN